MYMILNVYVISSIRDCIYVYYIVCKWYYIYIIISSIIISSIIIITLYIYTLYCYIYIYMML